MMQYAFVLGRVFTLSFAELLSVFEKLDHEVKIIDISPEVLVIETEKPFNPATLQSQLGGVIKILQIVDHLPKQAEDTITFTLQNYFKPSVLKKEFLSNYKGKIQFGISVYLLDDTVKAFGEPKRLGMNIKRSMQGIGSSIRLVLPKFNSLALASVVVTNNLLLEKGAEICVIAGTENVYVAKTLSVQDFQDYGRRDYQRPFRDEKQGMVPPKIAQVMLNLTGLKQMKTILDPLCGIGTMVQEGMLLNYRMLGTDINPRAISGSEKNLEWFRNRYHQPKGKYHVEVSDVKTVSKVVENLKQLKAFDSIDAIVTEGYLGPMYSEYPTSSEIKKNFKDLQTLYKDGFKEFSKFLSKGSKVVMCLPAYKKGKDKYEMMDNLDFALKNGYNTVDLISFDLSRSIPFLRLTDRQTGMYDRKDQIVAREIIIFEKS